MTRRTAYLPIHQDLLNQFIEPAFGSFNPRRADECYACYLHRLGLNWIASALGFPSEAVITEVSVYVSQQRVAFTIESPDFRESLEGAAIPQVEGVYNEKGFSHWQNDAAVVGDYVKHCDRPNYAPRYRWWLNPSNGSWRDRPVMI